ncbi:hypothetical protein PSHT_16499 [Puccinia striiformis]|uniref:Alpha-ketoglutarate-dependent dioxygenase AlkB-like domain-containing protein n=1 Tax=Puccinia striiformis TaxID=27350 RepID=A0A2S4U9L8_9BASI|nr:hypothetical protein PSHT_16499 [Puccinia striiformis]
MAQIPKAFRAHNLSSTRLMLGCSIDIGNVARRLYSSIYMIRNRDGSRSQCHSRAQERLQSCGLCPVPEIPRRSEQDLILDHSLSRLDKMERPRARKRCHLTRADEKLSTRGAKGFQDEKEYSFEAGHSTKSFQVYREMQVAKFVPDLSITDSSSSTSDTTTSSTNRSSSSLLDSKRSCPRKIDPHVDNLEASGSTIIGLSLGSTRVMRLGHKSVPIDAHLKVLLPPGSVYIQRDSVRYNLQHSIPANDSFRDRQIIGAQRLSVMLRSYKTETRTEEDGQNIDMEDEHWDRFGDQKISR